MGERDIVLTLKVPKLSSPMERHGLLQATVSYFDAVRCKPCVALCDVVISRPKELSEEQAEAVDEQVVEHEARIAAAEALARANELGRQGHYRAAQEVLHDRIEQMQVLKRSTPMLKQLSAD